MHFSIPDTQDFFNNTSGSTYTGFNIHINGSFHCCLRFKQLHSLHEQLKRSLAHTNATLPTFPPKKLLPLTNNQLEQRRVALEQYMQIIGQDPIISKSELLRAFLLSAQQESSSIETRETTVDVYLMNGYRIPVNCYTNDSSINVLSKACQNIELQVKYIHYFSLFLMRKNNDKIILIRILMDFESPYISQRILEDSQIIIRKNYWDPCYDIQLTQDTIALNLLFVQTISDIEKDWIIVNPDVKKELNSLKEKGKKKEYIDIARNLPSYGCIQFPNAIIDYPEPNNETIVIIGNRELCIRSHFGQKIQETKFRVTRMRCWRVTTIHNNEDASSPNIQTQSLELSFEYLMSKNCLKWITIVSEQAMLMSVCLQAMVDELIHQKDGIQYKDKPVNQPYHPMCYLRRDGNSSNHVMCNYNSSDTMATVNNDMDMPIQSQSNFFSMRRKIKNKMSATVFFRNDRESVQNEAFEEIGDDDL